MSDVVRVHRSGSQNLELDVLEDIYLDDLTRGVLMASIGTSRSLSTVLGQLEKAFKAINVLHDHEQDHSNQT